MGQIATSGVNNLAYFSRMPAITTPLPQNQASLVTGTILTFSNTPGYSITVLLDYTVNIILLLYYRKSWFEDRLSRCTADPSFKGCFPLSWSLSPHTAYLAPDWLHYYYNMSYLTGPKPLP